MYTAEYFIYKASSFFVCKSCKATVKNKKNNNYNPDTGDKVIQEHGDKFRNLGDIWMQRRK